LSGLAITPIFARFKRFDDGVIGVVKMFRRVFVRRRIAAADVTANFAKPQMNPTVAGFQTIFTAVRARRNIFYFFQMLALSHCKIPFSYQNAKNSLTFLRFLPVIYIRCRAFDDI
jgi:transposase